MNIKTNPVAGHENILELTTNIVASHVSNNEVAIDDLPQVIEQVFNSLKTLSEMNRSVHMNNNQPAVPIKDSITPDYLICLEDGKQLKMMKRHLSSRYNMTPDEYRQKWGLPTGYPMVAPNYANRRRVLAKEIGLGRGKTSR